jgi:uncharacterized beta barrel domain-containing protein DUF5777
VNRTGEPLDLSLKPSALSPQLLALLIAVLVLVPLQAMAQDSGTAQAPAAPDPRDIADRRPNLVEPDFTTVNLPTTLRLPRYRSAFRISHRFARTLNDPDFGRLASNLFGLDSGALIGLEYRFGVMRGLQAGIYRTSTKTIQFFGQYDAMRQSDSVPFTLDIVASIEGLNNFHRGDLVEPEDNEYATAVSPLLSRTFGNRAAFYLQPSYIFHSNTYSTAGCLEHVEHGHDIPGCADLASGIESNTLIVGLSTRLRVLQTVYVVGSWTPRASGFRPGVSLKTFGIEKRLRGHVFQLNVSNGLGTTMAEMARGSSNDRDWFLGFNISRKFF